MENQVEETGMERLQRLRAEAKELGITGVMTADKFEAAIKAKKAESVNSNTTDPLDTKHEGLTHDEAKKIEARMKYEFRIQEKNRIEIQKRKERASIITESESLKISISLPENPTELELAKARRLLGIKKVEIRPSPETVAIEASERGYYIFTNREQDDAAHTANLGGKYNIHLIPDQIHVLTKYHIKRWRQIAVVPVYSRVSTGSTKEGDMGEVCKRTGGKPRFSFEYLGEAPKDAPFGLVTDTKILDELKQEQLS